MQCPRRAIIAVTGRRLDQISYHSVKNLHYSQSVYLQVEPTKSYPTMCTGFSTSLCARNSLLMYSSPRTRISDGKCFR